MYRTRHCQSKHHWGGRITFGCCHVLRIVNWYFCSTCNFTSHWWTVQIYCWCVLAIFQFHRTGIFIIRNLSTMYLTSIAHPIRHGVLSSGSVCQRGTTVESIVVFVKYLKTWAKCRSRTNCPDNVSVRLGSTVTLELLGFYISSVKDGSNIIVAPGNRGVLRKLPALRVAVNNCQSNVHDRIATTESCQHQLHHIECNSLMRPIVQPGTCLSWKPLWPCVV